jgi:hypothetical protein
MNNISAEKVSQAGDVDVRDITIITSNGFAQTITPQVVGIEIFEDIFSTFITGTLTIRDSHELSNILPLIGEEVLRFEIATPSLPADQTYKGEYYIYKMDNRTKTAEREILYTLHFISKEAIIDLNKKTSKAYEGPPSDIILNICTDMQWGLETKKQIFAENTNNKIKYISNYWSPTQNIQYVCDHALNASDSPSMIFFENKHGFSFVALESLYTAGGLKQKFIWDNYTAEINPGGGSSKDIEKDYQRVMELDTPLTFNYMDRLKSGMYGSELITYDIMTQQYTHLGYAPKFTDHKHLNEYPIWTDKVAARAKSVVIHGRKYFNNFEGHGDVTNNKFIQKRKSLLAQAEAYKVIITVLGRTDYTAGQRVLLEIPKAAQIKEKDSTDEQVNDNIMSGVYLISAICHVIDKELHTCVLELIKESFVVNINA